jgi:hypothetical protein
MSTKNQPQLQQSKMGKGQLLFKGDKPKSKSKKHKSKKKNHDHVSIASEVANGSSDSPNPTLKHSPQSSAGPAASVATGSAATAPSASGSTSASKPSITKGTGRITTSGSVVTGHDTRFKKEINIGDAILVDSADGKQQEMRVVNMRLSDVSINLSSGFTTSLSTPTTFYYIRKPRNARQEQHEREKARSEESKERQMHAFDVYGGGGTSVVYREKTETGSYRIKTEQIDGRSERTRQDLLDLRAKKTSDKYC